MKGKAFIVLLTLTVFNIGALGTLVFHYLNSDRDGQGQASAGRFQQVKQELGLSGKQVAHFEAVRTEFHTQMQASRLRLEAMSRELIKTVWSDQAEAGQIETLLGEIQAEQLISQRRVIAHYLELKTVLSPEQWMSLYTIVSGRNPILDGVCRRGGSS